MRVFDLKQEYMELLFMLEDEEYDRQAVLDTLEGLKGEIEHEAEWLAKVYKQMTYDASALDAEIATLEKKLKRIKDSMEFFKLMMHEAVILSGHEFDGIQAGVYKIKVVKNGGKQPMEIAEDISLIPKKYHIPQPDAIDKEAIRKYLEEGNKPSWAQLKERGTHLDIR